jgi:outer membrane protein assembly factor BamA
VPDWSVSYAYARWRPTLFVAASSDTSFFAGPTGADGGTTTGTLHERQLEAGIVFPIQHTRIAHTAFAALVRDWDEFAVADSVGDRDRSAIRLAWATSTALTFGYSISPERGITVGATAELAQTALGSSGDSTTLTLDARAYIPGPLQHHVVAVRVGGGTSSGDAAAGKTFFLGGSGPNDTVIGFDTDALNLLRGFSNNAFAGRHVALLNADYRFPIARPQRGTGTWPFFVHTMHGAGFVDAGYAWTNTFDADSIKTSVGGEISADIVLGYYVPVTFTAGAAWGHDGAGSSRGGATFYARVGHAF